MFKKLATAATALAVLALAVYGARLWVQSERRMAYEDSSNPFFSFRNDICVSCARCVRACQEIQGTNALTMLGRGFWTIPVAGAASMSGSSNDRCS